MPGAGLIFVLGVSEQEFQRSAILDSPASDSAS